MRSLLRLNDLSALEIEALAGRAVEMARDFEAEGLRPSLTGKRIGLVVDDGGWRNPAAIDLGMQLLGAHCTEIAASLSGKEVVADLARYFGNWFDLIAIRSPSLELITALAEAADVPIVNLRTRENHPCETLGDLSYIKSVRRSLDGLTVAAVAPAGNIIHSWAEAAQALPLTLIQIYPQAYWIDRRAYPSPNIECSAELSELGRADAIITDCWPDDADADSLQRFCITADSLDRTKRGCLFIPCPPVTRGEEVSADAMSHRKCVVYDAKAYLMHAQNAFIEAALLGAFQ